MCDGNSAEASSESASLPGPPKPTELRLRYREFQRCMTAARVLMKVGSVGLSNLPHSLPEPERREVAKSFQAHLEEIETEGLPWVEAADGRWIARPFVKESSPLGIANDVAVLQQISESEKEDSSLQRLPFEQALIVSFAQFDAFLGDLVRLVCNRRPSLLSSDKQLAWSDVITAGSYEAVLDVLRERLADEVSRGDLRSKLSTLEKRLNISTDFARLNWSNFQIAEQIRHAFVHTGGKLTEQHLSRCSLPDAVPGQTVALDHAFSVGLTRAFGELVFEIMLQAEQKHWDLEHDEFGEPKWFGP